jgi:Flp pilus assembly pilin Flp
MNTSALQMLQMFWNGEEGQDLIEYSLLLALVAVAAIGILISVSGGLNKIWNTVNSTVTAAG